MTVSDYAAPFIVKNILWQFSPMPHLSLWKQFSPTQDLSLWKQFSPTQFWPTWKQCPISITYQCKEIKVPKPAQRCAASFSRCTLQFESSRACAGWRECAVQFPVLIGQWIRCTLESLRTYGTSTYGTNIMYLRPLGGNTYQAKSMQAHSGFVCHI